MEKTGAVTLLLEQVTRGERAAVDELLPLVYDDLREIARGHLLGENRGHTLNTTALVHEAYIKLADQDRTTWQNRLHFFGVASIAMRRILLTWAERRRAQKRGGGALHIPLDDVENVLGDSEAEEIIALNEALDRLADFNPRGAEVVTHRFFGGLTHDEIAQLLGTSAITVRRSWGVARSWLRRELRDELGRDPDLRLGAGTTE